MVIKVESGSIINMEFQGTGSVCLTMIIGRLMKINGIGFINEMVKSGSRYIGNVRQCTFCDVALQDVFPLLLSTVTNTNRTRFKMI